jgi:hypothetical protein
MALSRRRIVVLAIVALALATSSVWFFPNEGESQYTYDRAEVTVENGEIAYHGQDGPNEAYNNLQAVDCQYYDGSGRRCALDAYLADHGPVNVSTSRYQASSRSIPVFVELSDGYYRRVGKSVDEGVIAYDVEEIPPEDLLGGIATNTSGGENSQFISRRVAVSGAETSPTEPDEVSGVGEVYRVDGTYYVVVVSDRGTVDNIPVPFSHGWAQVVGLVWLLGLGLVVVRTRWEAVRTWLGSLRGGH